MQLFLHHVALCAPLFLLVALGWGSVKIGLFTNEVTKALGRFTFRLLMPVMLFKLMSGFADMPPVDWRILIAFFASCAIIYAMGRSFFKHVFKTDAAATTVQLGVPIVQVSLGNEAIPAISLIIIFNVLLLWTVAIASVEFGRTGSIGNWRSAAAPMLRVFKNPIVLGILIGSAWSFTGIKLPDFLEKSVELVAMSTTPMCLMVVGMGLAQHSFRAALTKGSIITAVKLVLQPLLVWIIAKILGLGTLETNAVVLMASLPVAINIYLMAQDFKAEEGAASNSIFVSTFLSALTVPLTLTLLGAAPQF